MSLLKKLTHAYSWERIFKERLTEPLHLNLLSGLVALGGSFRSRVAFDLVLRPQHAYSLLKSADQARAMGFHSVTVIEFGVASGAGLLNLCEIAAKVTEATGVGFKIHGFDTGAGMPPPRDYRDHPDLYRTGDYPMDQTPLRAALPPHAALVMGPVSETVKRFLPSVGADSPIGFISIDVDYYSSTEEALKIFDGAPEQYLPKTLIYLDDVDDWSHNRFCGELAALHEFNDRSKRRKIDRYYFLRGTRIFKNARWIDHMWTMHILDHPTRSAPAKGNHGTEAEPSVLPNPYLDKTG